MRLMMEVGQLDEGCADKGTWAGPGGLLMGDK